MRIGALVGALLVSAACDTGPGRLAVLVESPLYAVATGSGAKTMIVIHGGPGLRHDYLRPEFDALASEGRVVYYDQRGCGRSIEAGPFTWHQHVRDLKVLIVEILRLDRVTLIGSSWGAQLALMFALVEPELTETVVVSGLPSWPDSLVYRRSAERSDSMIQVALSQGLDSLTWQRAERRSRTERLDSAWMAQTQAASLGEELAQRLGAMCRWVADDVHASFATAPPVESLSALEIPVLVVHGARADRDARTAQTLRSHLQRGQVVSIPNAGHDPWHDVPSTFFSAVRAFISGRHNSG